jgi:hypothetical protein
MKKLLLVFILFITITTSAQHQFNISVDVKNLIIGSEPTQNNPALDLTLTYKVRQNNFELLLTSELFPTIDYYDYTIGVGFYQGQKFVKYANFNVGQIIRGNVGFGNYEMNIGLEYYFNKIGFGIETNINRRIDLHVMYDVYQPVITNNVTIIYKL